MAEKKKRAGRPKGALDKRTRMLRQAIQSGQTPLEFLLERMHDKDADMSSRVEAAKAAAPYCHARLQSITVEEKPWDGDVNSITNEQLARIISGDRRADAPTETPGKGTTH